MQVASRSWNLSTVSFKERSNYHIHCPWNPAWDELYPNEDDTSDTQSFADFGELLLFHLVMEVSAIFHLFFLGFFFFLLEMVYMEFQF